MGLLNTGITALLANQRALSVTAQNIANVNTEGYSRQRVDFSSRAPQPLGEGFIGRGVYVSGIERVYDEFITQQIRTNTAGYTQAQEFYALASQVDNLLADPQAGLLPALSNFFDALQSLADDPSSNAARQVLLSEAASLEDRFKFLDQRLRSQQESVNAGLRNLVQEVNSITAALANLNRDINLALANGTGPPNDLLDQRDALITKLSEYVAVTTVPQDDGSLNVFVGNGQAVVAGTESRPLGTIPNAFDPERLEVAYTVAVEPVTISDQLTGGRLGALLEFRSQVLEPARNSLGLIAVGLTSMINAQHRLGMDLNGDLGEDFFVPIDTDTTSSIAQALASRNNDGNAQILVTFADASQAMPSDYRLERNGDRYTLTRLSDGTTTLLQDFPSGTEVVDGLSLTLTAGTMADGDSFLIRPLRNGARAFALAIADPAKVAAAVPVRTRTDLANTGDGSIDGGVLVDRDVYVPGSYTVYTGKTTAARADGGLSAGVFTEVVGTDNALQYQLLINGTVVYTQNEGDAPLADLDALAAAINDDAATTGVRAYVDGGAGRLMLVNDPATSLPVTVTERLVDLNDPPLPLDAGDAFSGYFGANLTGAASSSTLDFDAEADAYLVQDGGGNTVTSGDYNPGTQIVFNGIGVILDGSPNSGDRFTVEPNTGGVGDNRNVLALAALQTQLALEGGSATLEQSYSRFVVSVGTLTRQAAINSEAQDGLLSQAIQAREAKSGVNLDEEAANMLRYQQAYAAAARVIAAADDMFQSLLDVVRR